MSMMAELLERLSSVGLPLNETISGAMTSIDPADFTDFHLEPFWHDRPVPFLLTDFGATRTISAPHMIVTLLHHLEVHEGQHILLIGSKGGYLASLLDHMVGSNGAVTIIEPHLEVRMHTEERLEMHAQSGLIRVLPPHSLELQDEMGRSIDRVLITGAVRSIPEGVDHMVDDGGFVLGPFGGPVHQRLIKRERQGNDWFDTDLGGVVFGPMDVEESERGPLDPLSLANHIEDALSLISGIVDIEEDTIERVEDLISSLREMPGDLPQLDEDSTEEDILEHPVVDLLMSEIEWLGPRWPLFSEYLSLDISNPGSPDEDDEGRYIGGHEDLVP